MNNFMFHPVGQGLFYTGSIKNQNFNFVYDCGTESKEEYVKKSIDNYINSFKNGEPDIDFVVISHLHKDHINGLPYLAKKAHIKRIFLPYLGSDYNLISLVLQYHILDKETITKKDYELYDFMKNLYFKEKNDNIFNIDDIVFLKEQNDDETYKSHNNGYSLNKVEIEAEIENASYWKFILINKAGFEEDLEQLSKKIPFSYNFSKPARTIQELDRIKDIYIEVFGDKLNNTSTLLLHYPTNLELRTYYSSCDVNNLKHKYCQKMYDCEFCVNTDNRDNTVTLLTGDAVVDKEMICEINKFTSADRQSNEIGFLQIPHHGSKPNWEALKEHHLPIVNHLIPFGLGNIHHHPNADVIHDLITSSYTFYYINQTQFFIYIIN